MKTYIWASDAGHEWLAVKITELVELGIADRITEYLIRQRRYRLPRR